jgi:hypothetical protein
MRHSITPVVLHRLPASAGDDALYITVPPDTSRVFETLSKRAKKLVGESGCARLAHSMRKQDTDSLQCCRVVIAALGGAECSLLFDDAVLGVTGRAEMTIWLARAERDTLRRVLRDEDAVECALRSVEGLRNMLPESLATCSPSKALESMSAKDVMNLRTCPDGCTWWSKALLMRQTRSDFVGMAKLLVDCLATCRAIRRSPYVIIVCVHEPPTAAVAVPSKPVPPGEFDAAAAQAEMDRRWNQVLEDYVEGRGVVMLGELPALLR